MIVKEEESEHPPFLKTWKNVYLLVLGVEVILILALYLFTAYFK